ncbi:putative secreted protein (Por secretion system target) [Larkinella arboricola]|uniref:Putative secreted protein (Por secretion system target) n=1 Tax=Larkinella arboricola TaxID=643671 RepID=A0A327WT10_LARAB|nr:M43 family zinc metalloprotease [Larkinella arboricola]RAJ94417.1 putative secreted protein (Por secretion system target) [Larkinella arboricola]
MSRRLLLSLILFLGIYNTLLAQLPNNDKCITMYNDSVLRTKYPQLGTLDEFEKTLQKRIETIKQLERTGRLKAAVLTIPVVVHVVHAGEAVGTGRNISQAQIQSQIETLNEDFRRKVGTRGYNENPVGADIEIEFCLATVNPQGVTLPQRGIDRINGQTGFGKGTWAQNDIENLLKPNTYWDPERYYNIWVLDFAATDNRLVGYAQFPNQSNLAGMNPNNGPASTDGVVIRYNSFGNAEKGNFPVLQAPYNLGRTLTHETGHWLGLRHIWGDANCGNDYVDDTPTQASESRGCQKGRTSCGTTNMVENYMDYSDDACFNIFTMGQKARIRAVMEISPRRANLINSSLCGTNVAGPPIPNFRSEQRQVLLGGQVRFVDLSTNLPTSWQWTFEGGTPSASAEQNPTVTYNTPGKFKVTLVAANSSGSSAPLVREAYIEVLSVGLCADQTNFNGTPTVLRQPNGTGYVAGQNSRKTQAVSELFSNSLAYNNMHAAVLRFGVAKAARGASTESVVTINVWNARGIQNGPGALLESKDVPLRTILDDVANQRSTTVVFDRNVPLSGLPFHIGISITQAAGDTIALMTTRNGESTQASAWFQNAQGDWARYSDSLGLNVAHHITARVGMKPSIQITASAQFVSPGEAVTLNARGAGIFNWSGQNLSSTLGAQVIARPTQTTSYTVTGSGLDLCNATATARIFVGAGSITEVPTTLPDQAITITPNPSDGLAKLAFRNTSRGVLTLSVRNLTGVEVLRQQFQKTEDGFERNLDLRTMASGLYLIEVRIGDQVVRKKIVKQ